MSVNNKIIQGSSIVSASTPPPPPRKNLLDKGYDNPFEEEIKKWTAYANYLKNNIRLMEQDREDTINFVGLEGWVGSEREAELNRTIAELHATERKLHKAEIGFKEHCKGHRCRLQKKGGVRTPYANLSDKMKKSRQRENLLRTVVKDLGKVKKGNIPEIMKTIASTKKLLSEVESKNIVDEIMPPLSTFSLSDLAPPFPMRGSGKYKNLLNEKVTKLLDDFDENYIPINRILVSQYIHDGNMAIDKIGSTRGNKKLEDEKMNIITQTLENISNFLQHRGQSSATRNSASYSSPDYVSIRYSAPASVPTSASVPTPASVPAPSSIENDVKPYRKKKEYEPMLARRGGLAPSSSGVLQQIRSLEKEINMINDQISYLSNELEKNRLIVKNKNLPMEERMNASELFTKLNYEYEDAKYLVDTLKDEHEQLNIKYKELKQKEPKKPQIHPLTQAQTGNGKKSKKKGGRGDTLGSIHSEMQHIRNSIARLQAELNVINGVVQELADSGMPPTPNYMQLMARHNQISNHIENLRLQLDRLQIEYNAELERRGRRPRRDDNDDDNNNNNNNQPNFANIRGGEGEEQHIDGAKLKFVKKYLKEQGVRATKGNINKCMSHMKAEGVVFS